MKKLIREIEKRYKVTFGNGGSEPNEITIIICRDLDETPEIPYGISDSVSFKWLDVPFDLITEYPRNEYYRSVKTKDIFNDCTLGRLDTKIIRSLLCLATTPIPLLILSIIGEKGVK